VEHNFMVEDFQVVDDISNEFLITKKFKTSIEFSQFIEKQANQTGLPCMELLVDYCVKNEIEMESVSVLLTSSLKEKIRAEAEDLNMLKRKDGKLPF
jgi:hypothetical protein